MDILKTYFPELTGEQLKLFQQLQPLYRHWNAKINVISRKDIDQLYVRHVLHSLGIAKVQAFKPAAHILDVGTGGGFPGIPLAILFPEVQFYLVDTIGKKIKVVQEISEVLALKNVTAEHIRAEKVAGKFDFIVSRAVTNMDDFVKWTRKKVAKKQRHELKNGILYLKGGDLTDELANFQKAALFNLADFFAEDFFETKKVVHLPLKYRP
jgi:16S rRNA (guanine527-N7)-methyltransferase